jgi:uncharacterized protein (DUF433 family)
MNQHPHKQAFLSLVYASEGAPLKQLVDEFNATLPIGERPIAYDSAYRWRSPKGAPSVKKQSRRVLGEQIMALQDRGMSYQQIGDALGISKTAAYENDPNAGYCADITHEIRHRKRFQIQLQCSEGKSVEEIARNFPDVPRPKILRWTREIRLARDLADRGVSIDEICRTLPRVDRYDIQEWNL